MVCHLRQKAPKNFESRGTKLPTFEKYSPLRYFPKFVRKTKRASILCLVKIKAFYVYGEGTFKRKLDYSCLDQDSP